MRKRYSRHNINESGFSLIELVMVIILLAVLAAVAIPNFQDMRTEARNEVLKGQLGAIRTSIAIARSTIALKEDGLVPMYPTYNEIQMNAFNGSHPRLNALPAEQKRIFVPDGGASQWPLNPWSLATAPSNARGSVTNCANFEWWPGNFTSFSKPFVASYMIGCWGCFTQINVGWCYDERTGEFWASTARNGAPVGQTENHF